MNTDNSSSFDFTEASHLDDWLKNLRILNRSQASSDLYQFILKLRQNPPPPVTKLAILDQLIGDVQFFSDQLEKLIRGGSIQSQTLVIKTAQLSTQLLSGLAYNYCQISKLSGLNLQQQQNAAYLGMHLMGLSLRKQAIFKLSPSTRVWKKTADLYQLALKLNILKTPITEILPSKTTSNNILGMLQRNLIFWICNPHQFGTQTIDRLFQFADRHFALLKLDGSKQSANFVWIPNQAIPPIFYNITNEEHQAQEVIYLHCALIGDQLKYEDFTEGELKRIQHRITGYQEILNNIIPSAPQHYFLILGFDNVQAHLKQNAARANIQRISSESKINSNPINFLQLVPLHSQATTISKQPIADDAKTQAFPSSVYNTRFESFSVASLPLNKVNLDQPLLLLKTNGDQQLGFIRQVLPSTDNISQRILIEIVSGKVDHLNLMKKDELYHAILIRQNSGNLEVLLPPNQYLINTKFESKSRTLPGHYSLEAFRENSPYFMRFTILEDQ